MEVIRPAGNSVLIKEGEKVTKTETGLDLPQEMQGKKNRATVLKVGVDASITREGDIVIYNPHAGVPIDLEDGTIGKIISESDIIAYIDTEFSVVK